MNMRHLIHSISGRLSNEMVLKLVSLEKRLSEANAIIDILLKDTVYTAHPSAGLNGQTVRKTIVRSVCKAFSPDMVIETGTFFGLSAGFFSEELGVPVYTSEVSERYYHVARRLLRKCSGITQFQEDSRSFLRKLAEDPPITSKRIFFYLDAHWGEDLPLIEELAIICNHWQNFCVLIDDFRVPWDDGYGYDDYGKDKVLAPALISDIMQEHELTMYLPDIPSSKETGGKRGCAFIIRLSEADIMNRIEGLRRYTPSG